MNQAQQDYVNAEILFTAARILRGLSVESCIVDTIEQRAYMLAASARIAEAKEVVND